MNVIKIELFVVDFDNVGEDGVRNLLENTRYPNHCIAPHVLTTEVRDAGEWRDDHPLNRASTYADEVHRLFAKEQPSTQQAEKRWPFVETPGQFAERLEVALREFGAVLPAVRHVLIETPPTLATQAAPAVQAEASAAIQAAQQRAEVAEARAAALQAERNAAYSNGLERAAMLVEQNYPLTLPLAAAAIRSLKTQEPSHG